MKRARLEATYAARRIAAVIMRSRKCDEIGMNIMNIKKLCPNSGALTSMMSAIRRRSVIGVIAGWLASFGAAAIGQVEGAPILISSLAELGQATILNQRVAADICIEGTVWWSSKIEGRVILNDDTATLQLELDLPCEMPALGDRLVIEGRSSLLKTRDAIKISEVPVVDSDGLHPIQDDYGSIYLKAGRHPIRVGWFNRTHHYTLEVEYEAPGVPRQRVPDDILFRQMINPSSGSTNFVNGLNYRCCEGQWWYLLPNLDHLPAVKTGVVSNFNIDVRSRNDHVGLQFSGYIEVPQDDEYTFHVWSDDGSRLFIGDPSLQVRTRGSAELPLPRQLPISETPDSVPEFQWSAIEGVVTSFHHLQGALEVDLMTEAGLMRLKVAEDSECSYSLRPHNRIRAVGVIRRILNLDGQFMRSEFYAQYWDDIKEQHITPTIWAEYPASRIGNLRMLEISNAVDSVVHINGMIESMDDGETMVLEDGTGRMILDGSVPEDLVGRSTEVMGLLRWDGSNLVLRCPLFNRLGEPGTEASSLPVLTTAEQICQLSLEEAARGYPVSVKGVITSPLEFDGAVIQDSTRGIYINTGRLLPVELGDYCEIEGVTGPFQFQPFIQVSQLRKLGTAGLPNPMRPTWDQLINGSMHCNYVELEGVVTSIKDATIMLLTRDGRINVRLNPIGPALPEDSLGATIRLHGCLLADWDGESRRVVVGSIFLDQHRVAIVHPAPVDPFAIPLKHVGDLLQFDPQGGALQRVKVSGLLTYHDEQASYLMEQEHGLRFMPAEVVKAKIGDRVEVVGFLDLSGLSPLLREAVVRPLGRAGKPLPLKLKDGELLRSEYDSSLVQVDGVLLNVSRRQDEAVLEMQNGHRRYMAIVNNVTGLDESLKPGSKLELTGVYVGQGGNRVLGQPINSFQLLLNSGRNVRILSLPPWWTPQRMFMVVGLLFAVLLATAVWINLLHHKVEQRTQQLGDQIRQRQRAEHQREIELERARLAHDLHDDLGAGLTEVNMLSSLVKSPSTPTADKERYADQMSELALRMVTSLDEIVWAENPSNDTVASLAGYFGAYAQRFLELASVGCGLDIEEDLPDHPLDPRFRRELFLAFKEVLTNVIKHAEATKVWLGISIQDETLVVKVSDDGCGVLPDTREEGADGLVNIQERLAALGGHCEIRSDPEKGTTVCLKAPIQEVRI
jgi:signal transduction histidine kinase